MSYADSVLWSSIIYFQMQFDLLVSSFSHLLVLWWQTCITTTYVFQYNYHNSHAHDIFFHCLFLQRCNSFTSNKSFFEYIQCRITLYFLLICGGSNYCSVMSLQVNCDNFARLSPCTFTFYLVYERTAWWA